MKFKIEVTQVVVVERTAIVEIEAEDEGEAYERVDICDYENPPASEMVISHEVIQNETARLL